MPRSRSERIRSAWRRVGISATGPRASERRTRSNFPSVPMTSSHQRATHTFIRVPRLKSEPCWNRLLRAIRPPNVARSGGSASAESVFGRFTRCNSVLPQPLQPFANFAGVETQVLSQLEVGNPLHTPPAGSLVNPRNRYFQQLRDFRDGQEFVL